LNLIQILGLDLYLDLDFKKIQTSFAKEMYLG